MQICKEKNNFIFHNELVKELSKKYNFGNAFDVTKLDSTKKLPLEFLKENYCILHLGKGYHKIVKGIENLYHKFEKIEDIMQWQYKKSLLNEFSESNILSIANNQRILHHFLFGEDLEFEKLSVENRPKTYFPHRTKATLNYTFNDLEIKAQNQQIEII